ncbi:hypothetical protein GCM10027074_18880 [Streptomyces deserti]
MHDDEGAVLAQVQIELDGVETRLLRGDEGPEGVLGFDTHDSAVTDGEEVHDTTRFRRRRRWAGRGLAAPVDRIVRARGGRRECGPFGVATADPVSGRKKCGEGGGCAG